MTQADRSVVVRVDAETSTGSFKPLHGVNNGPLCFGGVIDLTPWHRELGLPSTRLHDSGWPDPVVVDIPTIFPDFWADPANPANYRFERTDDYLKSLLPLTQKVVYRLGTSIEHTAKKYETAPPADFHRWAEICIGVIRHLNEGWADGHRFGIKHFEIWNEPDIGPQMWQGSQQDYFDLYAVAAKAIKAHDPSLQVGGPVLASPKRDIGPNFVKFITENDLPLDFFSWHTYAADPKTLAETAARIRALLDDHGLQDVESYLTEWNWVGPDEWAWDDSVAARALHQRNRSARGGAFVASSMILLQDAGVDDAHFFSGDTQWFGLFDEFGVPQKNYFGLLASARLFACPERLAVTLEQSDSTQVVAAAGRDGDSLITVISSFEGVDAPLRLSLSGQPKGALCRYEFHVIDENHELECTEVLTVEGPEVTIERSLPAGSVLMVLARPSA